MKRLVLAAALALAPAAAVAEQSPAAVPQAAVTPPATPADANPALWVVRDDDTTIYLFGTFHLLDGRPWFNDEIRTAFDTSSELVLEARLPENPAELQPLVVRYALDPNGRMLSQRLSAEQNAALREGLSGSGVPAEAIDRFEPWFVSMTLAAAAGHKVGLQSEHGTETVLTAAARERNIPIGELEGIEAQLRMLDSMPEEQQLQQLRAVLDNIDSLSETLEPMLAAWSTGDIDTLVEILNQTLKDSPQLYDLLFTRRNATWAGWIQERLARPGTVFLAVGAGHLAGADSVQTVLAARGVRAERVPHIAAPAGS